mmetsp:Transcript_117844/g.334116  ORF Transcript_117844/g.334116 Transcript_117844/m.334116 type:complete len:201 (+) Transcript_117844:1598-2200(+)
MIMEKRAVSRFPFEPSLHSVVIAEVGFIGTPPTNPPTTVARPTDDISWSTLYGSSETVDSIALTVRARLMVATTTKARASMPGSAFNQCTDPSSTLKMLSGFDAWGLRGRSHPSSWRSSRERPAAAAQPQKAAREPTISAGPDTFVATPNCFSPMTTEANPTATPIVRFATTGLSCTYTIFVEPFMTAAPIIARKPATTG